MIFKLKNITLLIFIMTLFLSCKGLGKMKAEPLKIGKVVSELDNRIGDIFQDSKGNYWFGSNGNGIYQFDGSTLRQIKISDGLVSNTIRGIQEDKYGNIYIETPEGISKYDWKNITTLVPITSNNEWKLEPDDLWFGYNANDLYRFDGKYLYELQLPRRDIRSAFASKPDNNPFENLNHNPYAVYGINLDNKGNLWVGTFVAGAFRYDGESFLWFAEKELSILPGGIAPGVRSIIQDRDGYFWLSNFKSKYRIDPKLQQGYEKLESVNLFPEIVKDKPQYFNSGIADKDGNLWLTTFGGGVWKYNGKTFSNIKVNNGIENVLLVSIYQDKRGTIWLGTDNDGVYKQNGKTFKKFEVNK